MSILFERIDALAKEKQLSFREIEVSAGLANNSIRRWNNSIPSADKLAAVARVLQVSNDYLLGVTDYHTIYEEFNAKYNKNDEMKQKVKELEAVDTIAAHLEDKEITNEKIEALAQYVELLFNKKK